VNEALTHSLWLATALMLVLEGIMPFAAPDAFKKLLLQIASMSDRHIRVSGLITMLFGLILLYWIN